MIKLHIRKKLNLADGKTELNIDTVLTPNSITAFYGPSGAGKSAVLKMIAGLMQPDAGIIEVNGITWFDSDKKINLPPQKRNTGFMFQDYALFPNMTVQQNLQFAKHEKFGDGEIASLLKMMQLEHIIHQKPALLSGGQQQRVALARAIIKKPQVLMLDEPLSAIGKDMRASLCRQLTRLHNAYGFTTILVSHEISEIHQLAQRVIYMESGSITADERFNGLRGNSADFITLTGEILECTMSAVLILINQQIISLPVPGDFSGSLQPGKNVTLKCSVDGMYIQKLY